MIAKFHKNNTNFQIAHFIAGSCYTPDAAYFQLKELREDREKAIENYNVVQKRNLARKIRAEGYLKNPQADEAGILEATADIEEIENATKTSRVLFEAAKDEIKFIDHCLSIVEPMCQYAGKITDLEAHESAQHDEWKFELINRAENALLTSGTIPAGEFATMRMHPAFKTDILPRIKEVQSLLVLPNGKKNEDGQKLLETQLSESGFNLLK